jgi:uroporphyrinogen III methyltransferase/synthase
MNLGKGKPPGKVYLIGAGPGDPGLLTLRALEILKQADVVLYDYLVNPVALRHAASAEIISLGKHTKAGQSRIWSQEEINVRLVELARAGKSVVRLKSGDPLIFGRLTEELSALVAAGIDYEVVPGVTAALAAGAFAGIPVTHRDLASAVAFITGQETKDKEESKIDFDALARFPGTLVFYMGVTTVKSWAPRLIEAGKPKETPVAIVRRCSFSDQLTITSTLGEIAELLTPSDKIRPPVIVIVGEVVKLRESLTWFEKRPLFGKRVLVTRAENSEGELTRLLEERGAEVISCPVMRVGPAADRGPLRSALERLKEFDWLLFSSANGVYGFFNELRELLLDARALGKCKIGAVGPGTAKALLDAGILCDVVPGGDFRAEGLVAALGDQVQGKHCLCIRGSRGRDALLTGLREAGANVEEVSAYKSTDIETIDPTLLETMAAGEIDYVLATSSSIARAVVKLFGEKLKRTKIVSLSSLTSEALREAGFVPHVEAKQATMLALVEALSDAP